MQPSFGGMPALIPTDVLTIRSISPWNLGGVSNARHATAEDGREFIIKGPDLAPGFTYVGINELATATFALNLNLPVLHCRLLEFGNMLFFGSEWMASGSFGHSSDVNQFFNATNLNVSYDTVAFDIWISNIDRHQGNLLLRPAPVPPGVAGQTTILLNDHSHCLMSPMLPTPFHLQGAVGMFHPWMLKHPFICAAIRSKTSLDHAVSRIESISDDDIEAVIRSMPDRWLPPNLQDIVIQALIARRDNLRSIIDGSCLGLFPNLGGQP